MNTLGEIMISCGGERGIRTLGRAFAPHSLSRRAPSADSAISPQLPLYAGVLLVINLHATGKILQD